MQLMDYPPDSSMWSALRKMEHRMVKMFAQELHPDEFTKWTILDCQPSCFQSLRASQSGIALGQAVGDHCISPQLFFQQCGKITGSMEDSCDMTCDKCFLSLRWFCSMIKWALSKWRVKLSNGEFSLLMLGTLLFWMQNRMRTLPTVGKVPAKLEHPHGLAVEISEKERAHECLDCRVHRYWMAAMNSISNTILGLHPSHSTQTTRFYVIRGDICLGGHPFQKKKF